MLDSPQTGSYKPCQNRFAHSKGIDVSLKGSKEEKMASDNAKWNYISVTGRGSSPLAFVNLRNDTKGLVVQ